MKIGTKFGLLILNDKKLAKILILCYNNKNILKKENYVKIYNNLNYPFYNYFI